MRAPGFASPRLRGVISLARGALNIVATLAPLCLWAISVHALQAPAERSGKRLTVLTTAQAVHRLSVVEAGRHYPIRLRAMVTYFDPYLDYPQPILMVKDATGSIFIKLPSKTAVHLQAGQLIQIVGKSVPGGFAPDVEASRITVLGASKLPASAPFRTLSYLLSGSEDAPWVEMDGVVRAVKVSEHDVLLKIAAKDGIFTAVTPTVKGNDVSGLIAARVKIRGVACSLFNKRRQLVGIQLRFADLSMLRVESVASQHPFDLPVSSIDSLLSYTPGASLEGLVHLRGTVTMFSPGRSLCIQNGPEGVCAETEQAGALVPGQVVDVIGFPQPGNYAPTLSDASYREIPSTEPVVVSTIPPERALGGEEDAALVQLDGTLIGRDRASTDPSLVLSSGKYIYSASLPDSPDARKLLELGEGSRLRIVGICSVQPDPRGLTDHDGYTVAKSFHILLRSEGDVVVLQHPSWWTVTHMLYLLSLVLLLTLCVLAWVLFLRKRVEEQKSLLQYQATHDGLTGLWNRKAILDLLRREVELAARSRALIGIMMLDADYFKRVNDTYGHFVGDVVLSAIAESIREAVRSTELAGRYGGEEFIIVLPGTDEDQLALVAERVRLTIAEKPLSIKGTDLVITVSIGTSILDPRNPSEEDALARADRALYGAKSAGRNRVSASHSTGVQPLLH